MRAGESLSALDKSIFAHSHGSHKAVCEAACGGRLRLHRRRLLHDHLNLDRLADGGCQCDLERAVFVPCLDLVREPELVLLEV